MVYPTCLCTIQTLEGEGVRNISFMIPFSTMTQSTTAYAICMRRLLPCEGIPSGKCCASLNTLAHLTHESSTVFHEKSGSIGKIHKSLFLFPCPHSTKADRKLKECNRVEAEQRERRADERGRGREKERRKGGGWRRGGSRMDGAAIGESAAFTV